MVDQVGDVLRPPGFGIGGTTTDNEILASSVGYTQFGVTIAAGQGILPAGTVLGQFTSGTNSVTGLPNAKKWGVYDNNAPTGVQTARAVLRSACDTTFGDRIADVVVMGMLKNSKLSGVDSAAIADFGARVDTVLDIFSF